MSKSEIVWGNIKYDYTNITKKENFIINIGDNFQEWAILHLYKYMGIPSNKIINISKEEIYTWQGEEMILPINCLLLGNNLKRGIFPFSEKIIPCFLGLSLVQSDLSEIEICYLKKFEPIGCRDENTCNLLRQYGINAYLNGCMTVTLPQRDRKVKKKVKVCLIDVPKEVEKIVFEKWDESEIASYSHMVDVSEVTDVEEYIMQRYNKYMEAELIVTSRLHAAIPCMVAGIPVIITKDIIPPTFSWIDKLIPIYKLGEYNSINWNVATQNCQYIGNLILENAVERLKYMHKSLGLRDEIEVYWNERKKSDYYDVREEFLQFIKENWDKNKKIEYGMWGINGVSDYVFNFIKKEYPQAVLKVVFDKYKKVNYRGVESISTESLEKYRNMYIFVTGVRASMEAKKYFEENKWDVNRYFLYTGDSRYKVD